MDVILLNEDQKAMNIKVLGRSDLSRVLGGPTRFCGMWELGDVEIIAMCRQDQSIGEPNRHQIMDEEIRGPIIVFYWTMDYEMKSMSLEEYKDLIMRGKIEYLEEE